jgi:arylsulfatase A-like enzyme
MIRAFSWFALVAVSLSCGTVQEAPDSQTERPNIIFIMADDLGYGDLGCYGATQIPTPTIDQLAAEGMQFTDAHSPAALCTPTRYGVLTGRYCWRSKLKKGVLNGYSPLLIEPGRMTVASLLKDAGYTTACVGKWHLGLGDRERTDFSLPLRPGPLDVGFDYFFGIPASLDMPPYCFIENDQVVGKLSLEKDPYNTLQREGPMTPGWKDEEVGPTLTQKSIEFIERNATRSFFLYLPYHAPHTPCTPPDFIKGRSTAGVRGDMVTELDWMVGEILAALDSHQLREKTLLFITSDNGALTTGPAAWANEPPEKYDVAHNGHLPNGHLRGQKADIHEGGNRVPLIAYWPGKIPAGQVNNRLVGLIDLMATCADLVGSSLPANAGEDSLSMLSQLLQEEQNVGNRETMILQASDLFAVRRGPWKLITGLGTGGFSEPRRIEPKSGEPPVQLYELELDVSETKNLWSEYPEVAKELEGRLKRDQEAGYSRPGKGAF